MELFHEGDLLVMPRGSDQKLPAEVIARFKNTTPANEKQEISEIPQWAKIALALHHVGGLTQEESAKRFKKARGTLFSYNASPAGKKWKANLLEIAGDPREVARLILRSSISGVAFQYLAAYEGAIEMGDYAEVGRMSRDLLDREDIIGKSKSKQAGSPPTINITLFGGTEPVVLEHEAEMLEIEAEIIEED